MRKLLVCVLLILPVLFLSSCSRENPASPEKKESIAAMGKVSLMLDKVNAPLNVATVTAILSRAEGDTLIKNLSMYGDSTNAEIAFENIKTGLWHLKIQAKGTSGEVLYSGETDLVVEDSKTTEVFLTLTPRPAGMGSVYISVKWGISGWMDYPANPIFTSSQALGHPYGGVSAAKVFFENGKYRMWYNNTYESARADIQYAESVDGIHWHNVLNGAVLADGPLGSWDAYMAGMTSMIKDDNGYKIYYSAYSNSYRTNNSVGLAVSQDGITWEKQAQHVFTVSNGEMSLCASGVVRKGSMYYMFYSVEPGYTINMAESQDGIHWTRYLSNPVFKAEKSWELSGVVYPSVIYDGTKFIMIYENWYRTGFGLAYSTDGITWVRDTKNPVLEAKNTKGQWTGQINYPFLFKDGSQQRIYYTFPANGMNNLAVAINQ